MCLMKNDCNDSKVIAHKSVMFIVPCETNKYSIWVLFYGLSDLRAVEQRKYSNTVEGRSSDITRLRLVHLFLPALLGEEQSSALIIVLHRDNQKVPLSPPYTSGIRLLTLSSSVSSNIFCQKRSRYRSRCG